MTPFCNRGFVETGISLGTLVGMDKTAASPDSTVDRSLARRAGLRDKHAQSIARLMEERADLRGVHALADFVDDAVRWSA